MRDAFGGIINISMIVVFLIIVSGYLAFNVSYTKAFRVKNKIITTIEQYEGKCKPGDTCANVIKAYTDKIGYHPGDFTANVDDGCSLIHSPSDQEGYFIEQCPASGNRSESTSTSYINDNERYYFKVETAIQIDIPIINKVMTNLKVFRMGGSTKLITVRSK
ncbi:MAG: hypothetical protein IKG58_04080 [Bacilli bacterium]|nr:hypothetical protein [Bacilli bacterium]MBR3049714.1 hypothetical protein [Bacilli bacterium]